MGVYREVKMVRLEGFEPPTNRIGTYYSIQLSYRRIVCDCDVVTSSGIVPMCMLAVYVTIPLYENN